ncbi:MAG: efflux RND transporter permease subunit, partial [Bacteroidota bacterium]
MSRAIAWMARHRVAANLLMLTILAVGFVSVGSIKQETFPEITLDAVQVRVPYTGATPAEIEEAIVRRVEEQVEGIEGIRRITSVAAEGVGTVTVELARGADVARALDEIQTEVDGLTTLPADAEKPIVFEPASPGNVMQIALYGDVPERTLKELAEAVKDDLTATEEISSVSVIATRPYVMSIEVSEATLRAYGLTLLDIASTVRRASLDLPGGSVETADEEILIRTKGQNYTQADFEDIVLLSRSDGTQIRLGDVAAVRDGFQGASLVTRFNDEPAVFVQVQRTGDERTLDIAERVKAYLAEDIQAVLPPGVSAGVWQDESEVLRSRLDLLLKNGLQGLLLVVLALMLFLNPRLAFWTSFGIFLSFMGTFAVMIWLDVSVSMISLFGFILAVGIVVDDAIVVGENIVAERERGASPLTASIRGASRVAGPVTFAVLTTMAAFMPLLFIPGTLGKMLVVLPTIVIAVLALSLVEVLFILPNHLAHEGRPASNPLTRGIDAARYAFSRGLNWFVEGPLDRSVRFSVRRYGLVIATAVALLTISIGFVVGGYIPFTFFPEIEGNNVRAQVELRPGTPLTQTEAVALRLEAAGRAAAEALQQDLDADHAPLIQNVHVIVGHQPSQQGDVSTAGISQSHVAEVNIELAGAEERDLSAAVFEQAWRTEVGEVAAATALTFASSAVTFGGPVEFELSADDPAVVRAATDALKADLLTYAGVFDVADDEEAGKQELQLDLLPQARTLGLTLEDLARQVRAAYFGEEAVRIQRGRDDVRVYVRLPEDERDALGDLSAYRIRTPQGAAVPLYDVATVTMSTAPTTITRRDGRRVIAVTANLDPAISSGNAVTAQVQAEALPKLLDTYPGLTIDVEGEQREQAETLEALAVTFPLALFVIYVLLAIPFGSYVQPLIVMAAIPFGLIGALVGHLLFGLHLGMLSVAGLIGLSGVIVNDSLVLVDFVNEQRRKGLPISEAPDTMASL